MRKARLQGFTLIELSIVLVIIGLIVGGVLVGQDLIRAAGVRATISQIEKYNTAVRTFQGKYGGLPGDLSASLATQFGFTPRAGTQGQGDGNGVIESRANSYGWGSGYDEPCMVWVDLSTANGQYVNLIDGQFTGGVAGMSPGPCGYMFGNVYGSGIDAFFPQAKLGGGNYVYVWSGGVNTPDYTGNTITASNGVNYFGISAIGWVGNGIQGVLGLTVQQAYSIDKKIDDGLPETGTVTPLYLPNGPYWAPNATSDSSTTCFNAATNSYSINISGGANVNCALSFRFQ